MNREWTEMNRDEPRYCQISLLRGKSDNPEWTEMNRDEPRWTEMNIDKPRSCQIVVLLCKSENSEWTEMNRYEPSTSQHSTAQHSTTQHSPAQHRTAQHSSAQHNTAQHITAQIDWLSMYIHTYICSLLPIASAPCLFAQVRRCVVSHISIAEASQLSCNDVFTRR